MTERPLVALIPGDGIGTEVAPAAVACIDAALAKHGQAVRWSPLDWGSDRYLRTGRMMPEDGLAQLARHDAIFLGAVGVPDIPDTETLWGLLIPIRREFQQYVNLRPVRALPGISSPVRGGDELDLMIVRENTEGEYSEIGGRIFRGLPEEAAIQENVFTRKGISRVAAYAARLASTRRKLLTSATKSNGILHTMPFWDEVVAQTAAGYPSVVLEPILIDALAAKLILRPASFDVIVASNLFGDILSDLAGAIAGSIGVAPSANLNPEGDFPSLFEPVHGSAPDIAGQGIANPIGQIWSGAMMLDHLGFTLAAADLTAAFESVVGDGVLTRDLGGTATTVEVRDAVLERLRVS
ncbi:tartrate dehydrogenase/decarboxylase / D-malate dehydrogenase [Agreia bicolorata]|uniref:D-malate dehydrogenase (decarboxylating) n=1 Tax=Agreia bicolorata TaxID=110935 RepID=A0A1T4WQ29_9MICO|nr:tartrate dehydrogenase [Agreia bicolorata]SKA79453.1 tartrate dehydrogenase/decarboxylase / D-malate dehydrogenase [Agreia bicolorata]